MAQPTPNQLHVDRFLTNVSVAFTQQARRFVAAQAFPIVPVANQSDLYAVYPRGFFFRDLMRVRPLGGRAAVGGYEVTQQSYRAEEWALAHTIDDRQRANADQPLDPDRAGARFLTTQAMIRRDRLWASKYFQTGVWTTDRAGVPSGPSGTQFIQFDQSASDPVRTFKDSKKDVGGSTGYRPNTLVLGEDVYLEMVEHADIKDRIKYVERASVNTDTLAALIFDDDPDGRVIIAGGVYNAAQEGAADANQFIVGAKDALLVYRNPNPRATLDEPSGGYTFAWMGLLPGETNAFGGVVMRGRDDFAHSDLLEIRNAFDLGLVAADLGVFFSGAVA